jgi:ribonuclease HI
MDIDHPYILDIKKYSLLTKQNTIVEFCWIPSHFGSSGNTKADKAA